MIDSSKIDWSKNNGLVPVIVQDTQSLRVLMLGYMNVEALKKTLDTGLVTFFSRSKQRLWQKGETSGHVLKLKEIKIDCDNDTLLALVEPTGPVCHNGTRTCFGNEEDANLSIIADLEEVIRYRHEQPSPGSYTSILFDKGVARIAQKVGEEGVEVALAAATDKSKLAEEAADLLYHVLVLLESCGKNWRDVMRVLKERFK